VDLLDRAGDLKGMLVEFALSARFERELSAVIEESFPSGIVSDEAELSLMLDPFVLQHRLPSGATVVEEFVAAHPELPEAERDMLLGWRDVVEGVFDVTGKERDALVLVSLLDELTYRARSNVGRKALRPFRKGMFFIGRLVPVGEDWMVSGNPAAIPASAREQMLVIAAEQAMRHPEAVFRNPDKLAAARQVAARHHQVFVEQFGTDLVVVPGDQAPRTFEEFHRRVAERADHTGQEGEAPAIPSIDFPADLLFAESVVIFSSAEEGLSLYPDYRLMEELFSNPKLIARRPYRETLAGYLEDPDAPPELIRRLAARDPGRASTVFTRFLRRKRGFRWETDGEELLRQHKPGYFDSRLLPRTVVLPERLSSALRRARGSGSAS
jgi:hypothetical protein